MSGLTYNYRVASKTSDAGLTSGSKTYTVTTVDVAGNSSGAVELQRGGRRAPLPGGSNVQTANASGSIAGRPDAGDTITFTFGEAMDPASILATWTGTSTNVTVSLHQLRVRGQRHA